MSSFFQTVQTRDPDAPPAALLTANPWKVVLGVLAGVLVLGGVITVPVGLGVLANYQDVVLGQSTGFDEGVATAIVGGVAILLGILVGTTWLVLGAVGWRRRS